MSGLNVFKFLDSYTKEDRSVFFGREAETEEIYQRCSFSKTLVVYGRSGTGKTSIIRCGLGNAFDDQDWLPVFVRRSTEINRDTIRAIRGQAVSESKEENSLSKEVRNLYLDHFKPVYLIFDQFEELFIFGGSEEIKTFFASIKTLIESDQDVHLIFVIREEYLAYLTEAEEVIPEFLENRIRIEHLTAVKLRETVEKMCEAAGIGLEDGFSEELTERMTSGKAPLELSYLQVYLDSIRKKYPDTNRFSKEMIEALGSFGDVLGDFLQRQLNEQPDPAKAETVLKAFVSAQGTKRLIDTAELKQLTAEFGVLMEMSELETYVNRFIDGRILRQVGEDGKYELRHDTLAKVIYERITLAEKELLEAKQFVHNAYNRFQKNGTQLRDEDLDYLAPYAKRLYLKDEQKKFLNEAFAKKERRQKRKLRLTQVGVGILLLLLIGAGYLLYQNYQERQLQARIDESHRLAKLSKSDEIGDPMLAFLLAEKAHEIYEGPHTHNALLEAYDRGPGKINIYPFQFLNFEKSDLSLTLFSDSIGIIRLKQNHPAKFIESTAFSQLTSLNMVGAIFTDWGYLLKNDDPKTYACIKFNGDTTLFIDNGKELSKIHSLNMQNQHTILKSGGSFYLLDKKGDIFKTYEGDIYEKSSNEFIRHDTLFIFLEKEVMLINYLDDFQQLGKIDLDIKAESIDFIKENKYLELRSTDRIVVLEAQSFKKIAEIDLKDIKQPFSNSKLTEFYENYSIRISHIFKDEVILEIQDQRRNSESETPFISLIFDRTNTTATFFGGVDGRILSRSGKRSYLVHYENLNTVELEEFKNKNQTRVNFSFSNSTPIAQNAGRIILVRTNSAKTNSVNKTQIDAISLEGDLIWTQEIHAHNAAEVKIVSAFLDNSNQTVVLCSSKAGFFLFNIDQDGNLDWYKRLFDPKRGSLGYKPRIIRYSSKRYIVEFDDQLVDIQKGNFRDNISVFKEEDLKGKEGNVIMTFEDSSLFLNRIGKNAEITERNALGRVNNLESVKFSSANNAHILSVSRSAENRNSIHAKNSDLTVTLTDYYSIGSDLKTDSIYSTDKKTFYSVLGNSSYKILFKENARTARGQAKYFYYLLSESGKIDSISEVDSYCTFIQFGQNLFACLTDTILKVHLDDLTTEKIPKPGINRWCGVYAESENGIPLIKYRPDGLSNSSWLEIVDSSGSIDTIFGNFIFKKIDEDITIAYESISKGIIKTESRGMEWITSVSSFGIPRKISGNYYILNAHGKIIQEIHSKNSSSATYVHQSSSDGKYFLVNSLGGNKIVNHNLEPYLKLTPWESSFNGFIQDKYILTSHRLLNQYELFPINGEVAIEMVREQGRLGEVREFTQEELEKYGLN